MIAAVIFGAVIWAVTALGAAVLVGKSIAHADAKADEDWLADQPAEVLAPAEIDRRIARLDTFL